MYRKPLVGSADWYEVYNHGGARVQVDRNSYSFMKVVINSTRPKYFYGENSHADVMRFVVDKTGYHMAWRMFD